MNKRTETCTGERTGARILVDQLKIQKVDRISCVPGESYLAVLDALHDTDIDVLTCRSEGGAAMMAEAYAKLTGRPGICMVTRGPGATNAAPGLHIARHDSTPLILFVGQVDSAMREREAFQEIDYRAMYGGIAKWVVEIDRPERVAELVTRAFRIAMQGRPGPVVVSLPEDMLTRTCMSSDSSYVVPSEPYPNGKDIVAALDLIRQASSPLIVLGGTRWKPEDRHVIARLAEQFDVPVATSFRRASLFAPDHSSYAGDLGLGQDARLRAHLSEADVVLLVGGRLSEIASHSYTLMEIPTPRQKLIHVHPDSEELGKVYAPALAIEATPAAFCAVLAEHLDPGGQPRPNPRSVEAHEQYVEWSQIPAKLPGAFQYGEVVCWLRDTLPADAIVCNGAGNYTGWLARHFRYGGADTQLAPTSGSMGYGVPAAVMAKRLHPDRTVVAFAGDGCFLMNGQEFATAAQYRIPVIIVVLDNGQYGTIRMHQERDYPDRVVATQLNNPDFAAYARAFGGHGETATDLESFKSAFARARDSALPSIIHCMLDRRAVSHRG